MPGDHVPQVKHARRLIAGVHRQLGHADIDGVQRDVGVCDVAQRRAAHDVRAVDKVLARNILLLAQLLENRRGNRIGGVALVGVVLDDDALV